MAKPKQPTPQATTEDQKTDTAADAVSGPGTPATGNEGAAEAGEVSAGAAPAEASAFLSPPAILPAGEPDAVDAEVKSPIEHDGQAYGIGSVLRLPLKAYQALKSAGVVE